MSVAGYLLRGEPATGYWASSSQLLPLQQLRCYCCCYSTATAAAPIATAAAAAPTTTTTAATAAAGLWAQAITGGSSNGEHSGRGKSHFYLFLLSQSPADNITE